MVFLFLTIIFAQNIVHVLSSCTHDYIISGQIYSLDHRYQNKGYTNSTCYMSHIYNPTSEIKINGMLENLGARSDNSDHVKNTMTIYLQNNMISNFSTNLFISNDIACYYGRIHLFIEDSQVVRFKHNAFPSYAHNSGAFRDDYVDGDFTCNVYYESISLRNNKIKVLQSHIFNDMANLSYLNLANNNINYIAPLEFSNLENFTTLILAKNNISSIENIFGNLDKLHTLDISNNSITNISKTVFENLKNMLYLNLSSNFITLVEQNTFIHLNQLLILDISNNLLKSVDIGSFSGLNKLLVLNVSNNQLTSHMHILVNVPELSFLDISYNNLEDIDLGTFDDHHLNGINIDGNKFTCPQLTDLINYFKRKSIKVQFGQEKDGLNIFGIHCNNTENNQNISTELNVINDSNTNDIQQFFTAGFKKSAFYNYFNTFASKIKNQNNVDQSNINVFRSLETSNQQVNVTLLQILAELKWQRERKISDIDMFKKYFTEDVENSKLFEILNNLHSDIKTFDNTDKLNELISEKYVQTMQSPPENHGLGIFNVLIIILCFNAIVVIAVVFKIYCKGLPFFHRRNINDSVSRIELSTNVESMETN